MLGRPRVECSESDHCYVVLVTAKWRWRLLTQQFAFQGRPSRRACRRRSYRAEYSCVMTDVDRHRQLVTPGRESTDCAHASCTDAGYWRTTPCVEQGLQLSITTTSHCISGGASAVKESVQGQKILQPRHPDALFSSKKVDDHRPLTPFQRQNKTNKAVR